MSSSIVPLPTGDDSTVNHNQGSSTITHGWRFMLLEVKLLHFKRQYRLCIRLSEELLSNLNEANSVWTTYLNFYAAISHECLACAMPNHATNKISTLDFAEDYYIAALQSLASSNIFSDEPILGTTSGDSILEVLARHHRIRTPSQPTAQDSRPTSASSASSKGTASDDTILTRPSSGSSMCPNPFNTTKSASKGIHPAPQKSRSERPKPPLGQGTRQLMPRSLTSTPPLPENQSAVPKSEIGPIPASPNSPGSTDNWLLERSKAKYNAHLGSLRDQLEYHIRTVQELKATTVKTQRARRLTSAPASYWVLPTGTMSEKEKQQRIQDGRERGWTKKSAFGEEKAEKIRLLCEQALREL